MKPQGLCQTCSIRSLGRDSRDLAGLVSEAKSRAGWVATTVCAGCGPITVDHLGRKTTLAAPPRAARA